MIFRLDVCGILCVLMTFGAIGYADYAVMYVMVLPTFVESIWGTFHIFIFNSLLFLGIIAHFKAMTTDPGIVPLQRNKKTDEKILKMEQEKSGHFYEDDYSDSEEDEFLEKTQLEDGTLQCIKDNWTVCMRCRSFRPPRAHHCRVCQRCVSLYDHHCPWVNNCIGEFNQKYFLQFLLFIGLSAIYAIFVVILSWSFHDDGGLTGKNGPFGESAHHLKVLHTIFLTIESSMFGMFVLAVSCDQLQAIFKDETPIERLQRRGYSGRRTSKSKYSQMAKVCGQAKWYKWFIPCTRTYFRKEIIHFPQESRTVV